MKIIYLTTLCAIFIACNKDVNQNVQQKDEASSLVFTAADTASLVTAFEEKSTPHVIDGALQEIKTNNANKISTEAANLLAESLPSDSPLRKRLRESALENTADIYAIGKFTDDEKDLILLGFLSDENDKGKRLSVYGLTHNNFEVKKEMWLGCESFYKDEFSTIENKEKYLLNTECKEKLSIKISDDSLKVTANEKIIYSGEDWRVDHDLVIKNSEQIEIERSFKW